MKFLKDYTTFINESILFSSGIKNKHIKSVLFKIEEQIKNILGLNEEDYSFVGSAGKREKDDEIIYNINLGIDRKKLLKKNNLEEEELNEFLEKQFKRLKKNIQFVKERNELITEWEVPESEDNKTIELKVKLTDNLKWLKFSRFAPLEGKQSKYHSKYREAFISAISESIKKEITQYYNDKELVKEYNEYEYDSEDGLFIVTRSFEGKNGILKKARILEESKRLITDSPEDFVKVLLGEDARIKNMSTFERILEYVESDKFPYKKKRKQIFEKLRNKLIGLRLKIPEDIKNK